jgi:hypothetical protein
MTNDDAIKYDFDDSRETSPFIDIAQTVRRHRGPIVLSIAAITLAYVIAALAAYIATPAKRVSTLEFRLDFEGAEEGLYPNGTVFSPTELTAQPVLIEVFEQNGLEKYMKFSEFRTSVFVEQANRAREQLAREYAERLGVPALTFVERREIEREYAQKLANLSHNSLAVTFVSDDHLRRVPSSVRHKILSDILSNWASRTVKTKGVLLYDIDVLSSSVFHALADDRYDYLIVLDLLRTRIQSVIANIDQLMQIPGAKIARDPESGSTLAEVRLALQDTLNFQVRPAMGFVLNRALSQKPESTREFLQTQLQFAGLNVEDAQDRVAAVRGTLEAYLQDRTGSSREATGSGFPVIPQIDQSFLDRIVQLTDEGKDITYRQQLVDRIQGESLRAVPIKTEMRYYESLIQSFSGRYRQPSTEEAAIVEAEISRIIGEAASVTDRMNRIYGVLSRELEPLAAIATLTAPPRTVTARGISLSTLALIGVLLFLVTAAIVPLVFVVREKLRRSAPVNTKDSSQNTRVDHARTLA